MGYRFLIPSRGRPHKAFTLCELLRLGIDPEDVTICISKDDSEAEYRRAAYASASNIIVDLGRGNVASACNTLIEAYASDSVVFVIDDDSRALLTSDSSARKFVHADRRTFLKSIDAMAEKVSEKSICIAAPNDNTSYANMDCYSKNFVGNGWIVALRPSSVRFDDSLCAVEDIDLQARIIANGGTVYRYNHLTRYSTSRRRKYTDTLGGGRGFKYEDRQNIEAERKVYERYRPLLKMGSKPASLKIDRRYI